jgi:O-antigen/teichoic acid export membrane protein
MTPSGSPGLRGRTLRNFLLLGAQRVLSLLMIAAGGILLARLLTPEEFGLYAIIAFAIGLGVTFSDLGLGTALIQRRDLDPSESLGAAFLLNLALAAALALAIAALAPFLARWLAVATDVTAPLRCLAALIVLSSLRMPAAVLLERRLAYLPLTVAETADTVVFYAVAVAAAAAATVVLAAGALRRLVPVRLLPAVRVPLAAGFASALVLAAVAAVWIHDIPSLLIGGGIAAATYVGLAVVLGGAAWRGEFVADWRMVLQGVRT